ncbi:cytochrome P450 [Gordonia sp. HNM0687]|uniref:Cytochrome P450 n=1 Tax=Gordonia mangrovi TaxID=2665643 RepID=A0A6L7GN44_9ACTN|nr:cytochrome P450 [Gordonia mangrovi]
MNALPLSALPHPPGRLPVLGDVRSVDRRRPTQHETELTRELGPIFQRELLGNRLVVVGGADLARQTLDEESWGRVLVGPLAQLRAVAGAGLFTARTRDPLWGQARRILTPGFAQAAMRVYHDAMASVADDLTQKWTESPVIDVHRDMTAATLEVIGRAGFSRRMGLLGSDDGAADGTGEFLDALGRILLWAGESTNDVPMLGPIREVLGSRRRNADIATGRRFVSSIIETRVREGARGRNDLLGLMLETADPETGERLPLRNVTDQVLTFLAAGHETTAALMEVALYYLAAEPEVADRIATTELDGTALTYENVVRLRQIRAYLNECLRLWPPAPGFFRLARTDQVLDGYHVPAGRAVFVLALAAQRDPAVWGPDADLFRADRFLGERLTASSRKFFAPWGTGPRSCIGRQFAIHESSLLLASVLSRFDLRLEKPTDLVMRERATLRPEPFTLVASPRTTVPAAPVASGRS